MLRQIRDHADELIVGHKIDSVFESASESAQVLHFLRLRTTRDNASFDSRKIARAPRNAPKRGGAILLDFLHPRPHLIERRFELSTSSPALLEQAQRRPLDLDKGEFTS